MTLCATASKLRATNHIATPLANRQCLRWVRSVPNCGLFVDRAASLVLFGSPQGGSDARAFPPHDAQILLFASEQDDVCRANCASLLGPALLQAFPKGSELLPESCFSALSNILW